MAVFPWLRQFAQEEQGASAAEYVLLLSLIAVVIIVAVTALGTAVSDKFETINSEFPD